MAAGRIRGLIPFLALCLAAEFAGSLLTTPSIRSGWYGALAKPTWNPPNWVFGPVWTFLFLSMAVAAWLVWRRTGHRGLALPVFYVQLALNVLWSALFFGLMNPGWAFLEILLLLAAIAVTALLFFRVSLPAGTLMVPYLLWVGYASALTFAIWRLNP